MRFEENGSISPTSLADLRESVGWNRMENCYQNTKITSYFHIAVYDGNLLIGFIDCISNAVTDAYIQDLIVHPDYQKKRDWNSAYESYDLPSQEAECLYDLGHL